MICSVLKEYRSNLRPEDVYMSSSRKWENGPGWNSNIVLTSQSVKQASKHHQYKQILTSIYRYREEMICSVLKVCRLILRPESGISMRQPNCSFSYGVRMYSELFLLLDMSMHAYTAHSFSS
jgi:hypothetical protein